MGLTGQSFNANVGSVSIEDQVVGLTGFTITATVGTPFIIHYQDVDTGSNTNYTGVSTGSNTSYSRCCKWLKYKLYRCSSIGEKILWHQHIHLLV
jgi:hypothetical protein